MRQYSTFCRETLFKHRTKAEQCEYLLSCEITTREAVQCLQPCLQAVVGDFQLPVYCSGTKEQTIQKAVLWLKEHAAEPQEI